jgi:hypothetical protein
LILFLGSDAQSATIVSSTRYEDLADAGPPYPIQTVGGGPSFALVQPWFAYWGNIRVASDPDEQIYDLVLNFRKDSGQRVVDYEFFTGAPAYSGVYLGDLAQPGGGSLQDWRVDWNVPWFYPPGWGGYYNFNDTVVLTGTATLSVSSSAGDYDLATYSYSYLALVPEPSTGVLILLGTACVCGLRRRELAR